MSDWALGTDSDGWPTVSVVMPVRNEAAALEESVAAVLAQEYPREFEVCLAVAPSHDDTEAIAVRLATGDVRVTVVANPAGTTPAGLNAAIRATDSEVVVRVDGHCRLSPGYVRTAVETMAATDAVNVGGVQHAVGSTDFTRAVAAAMTSRLGTGGARFHVGGAPGPVDTVYLGVFRRRAIEAVGLFDERLIRNQDYELNIRLRGAGGVVWFSPDLAVTYQPRRSLVALARQYWEYGWWKAVVARLHPRSLKVRQLAPVAATIGLFGALVTGAWYRLALLVPLAYATVLAAAGLAARSLPVGARLRLPAVLATMHLAWGAGFIVSALFRRRAL